MEEDSVEKLRKELVEVREQIRELLEKQTKLEQRLEALAKKDGEVALSELASVQSATPANIAHAHPEPELAEPLSKRLDVALRGDVERGKLRKPTIVEDVEEIHDRQPSRSTPSTAPGVHYVVSLAASVTSWDALSTLLRSSGYRSSVKLAWTCRGLLSQIQDVAFAFQQWFPSRVLVLGGGALSGSKSSELFDGSWRSLAEMAVSRAFGAALCTRDGRVLVMGGKDGDTILDSVEEYDLDRNLWQTVAPMQHARWGATAVEFQNEVYVIGGRGISSPVLQCERLSRSKWQLAPSLIEPRISATAAVLGGDLFVLGGGGSALTAERLDLEAGRWTIEPLPTQVQIYDDMIYSTRYYNFPERCPFAWLPPWRGVTPRAWSPLVEPQQDPLALLSPGMSAWWCASGRRGYVAPN
ncbi:unnamed protein product [Durusdinium trenchii]|uniref:Uncharacterized protein n=1 Tax=Durusdinium trenchii TaxID=1381693 RepID=A0ABP0LFI2_9DINO